MSSGFITSSMLNKYQPYLKSSEKDKTHQTGMKSKYLDVVSKIQFNKSNNSNANTSSGRTFKFQTHAYKGSTGSKILKTEGNDPIKSQNHHLNTDMSSGNIGFNANNSGTAQQKKFLNNYINSNQSNSSKIPVST